LGEKWPVEFCLRTLLVLFMPEGSFTCRKSTTWDRRLYFRIFIILKNPSPSVGIEPANLGSTLTTSPPRATLKCLIHALFTHSKRKYGYICVGMLLASLLSGPP
jgi:hypothetical protein